MWMGRVLMIVSSARTFELARDPQHPTGYWAEEVLKPYDRFVQAGLEVAVATADGRPPQADPFGLESRFHYPDEDEDFLASIERTFAPDVDDVRVTLHQFTELDLIAARRVFLALLEAGVDPDAARSLVARHARTAWRDDRNLVEVLAEDPEVTSRLLPERLRALALEVQDAAAVEAGRVTERLSSIESLQHPLDLRAMSDEDVLGFDAVFFPGGHGPMVDLAANPDVRRILHLLADREEKTISAVCHGSAALLSAGQGPEGAWLFDGYKMTGFTDEEEDQTPYGRLGVPWYVESALKNRGAVFDDADAAWVSHVVVDRNLVTGQNPGASEATADAIIKRLGAAVR
jgi:putative intracellular protease/amidase